MEETFARILEYYGIKWEYEPTTFVLRRDEEGNVLEAFAPDFYLPEQDLYVELTTLRPQLIRHKNRKIRLMRELYPHVNVKLFKRQDIRALMLKFGLTEEALQILGTEAQRPPASGNGPRKESQRDNGQRENGSERPKDGSQP